MNYHQILNTVIYNKGAIIKATALSVVLLFLILYFIYPLTYRSTVTILPPENKQDLGGLGTLLGAGDFSSLITGGLGSANSQLFIEMLKSRTAAEYVVEKHNLVEYFDKNDKHEAVKELQDRMVTELTKEGIVKLSVAVKTPLFPIFSDEVKASRKMAADLSNSYVEALDMINKNKLSSKAKRAREYIEEQLVQTSAELDSVEIALSAFQKSNKTIALPDQMKAAIDAAAKIKSEIVKTEIELGMLQNNLREDNKTLIALNKKLGELREQYSRLEFGNEDFLLAFKEVPDLGRELATLMREVKIQNEVYLLLQQQYYKEKIQENRDLPTVEVLDEAIPPQKPVAPRTIFSTVVGGAFVFFIVSLVFIIQEKKIISLQRKENKIV